jgi:AraC-like DNA-binding protein
VVFVHALHAWLDEQGPSGGGWFGALRDPHVGAALSLVHRDPARNWTVASLASAVGMSRSPFAERFRALVGEPPLAYVTRWRMQLVAGLLRDGRPSLREMAERAGYESEPAFSKAFKRHFGVSPTAYRQRVRAPDNAPTDEMAAVG